MKKFECNVKMDRFDEDIIISVTVNGRQWTIVSLNSISQLIKVRNKINKYLASKSPNKANTKIEKQNKQSKEIK